MNLTAHPLYDTTRGFVLYWICIAVLLYIVVFKIPYMNAFMNKCSYMCDGETCTNVVHRNPRGAGYFIDSVGDNDTIPEDSEYLIANCFATKWSVSHFVAHMLAGILFPSFLAPAIIGGAAFEYYEYVAYDCHDGLDVIMNTLGFITGITLNKLMIA